MHSAAAFFRQIRGMAIFSRSLPLYCRKRHRHYSGELHYLKSCLKSEAEMLVRNLPTTNENFSRAWKTLTNYYENKKLLVYSYISQFTALQKLKGD
jgi:hypothetical protein